MTPLRSLFAVLGATAFAAAPLQETKPAETKTTIERTGTFVPGGAKADVEVRLGLESYGGALEWVEVMAHGSLAREGDAGALRYEGATTPSPRPSATCTRPR